MSSTGLDALLPRPYVKDMFSYGQAGIFGARKPTRGLRRIAGGSILAAKETASGRPAAAAQVEQKEKAAAPAVAKRTSLSGGADGWISEEAKNAAAVYGIVNPSEEDKMLSKEELEKKFANVIETPGKEKDADGWVNEGAKNAAAMYGIVNPSIVDELTDPSMKSEQFQKKQMMLNELKRKELDRLKRLAHVSLFGNLTLPRPYPQTPSLVSSRLLPSPSSVLLPSPPYFLRPPPFSALLPPSSFPLPPFLLPSPSSSLPCPFPAHNVQLTLPCGVAPPEEGGYPPTPLDRKL
eukprot:242547-Hanusia_phi.AAC.2